MAEPVYPSLEEGGNRPIGFEGITEATPEPERQRVDDKRLTSGSTAPATEEIQLLTSEERREEVSFDRWLLTQLQWRAPNTINSNTWT